MTTKQLTDAIWPKYQWLNFGEVNQVARAMQKTMADELRRIQRDKIKRAGKENP